MVSTLLLNPISYLAIAAILLVGVPHGGLDGAVARRSGWPQHRTAWLSFHAVYIGLAALVAWLWWLAPLTSLIVFLGISAFHFGSSDICHIESPSHPRAWPALTANAGLVTIAIPTFQAGTVGPLFTVLVGFENSIWLLAQIQNIFLPWMLTVFGFVIYALWVPQWRVVLANLLFLIILAYSLPPLVSFALYFCCWHSRRHLQRTWRSLPVDHRRRCGREALLYSLMAYSAGALFLLWYKSQGLESLSELSSAIIQLTFIGLAALTVPHMLLVDFFDKAPLSLSHPQPTTIRDYKDA
ncbi:MAG: Brp/Blh family beta-carotene 15,15'-monooxygenase [Porticoccaceae bacterium]